MRHPDEGEIHAWLDGALDPAASAELEAHVAACAECAAAVAEARGLIAGASRILLALDGVPSGVIPAPAQPTEAVAGDELATRREARRNVPWYARRPVRIAAGLMLVVGVGGIVARERNPAANQVSVQFETDAPVGASKGPAADAAGGSVGQAAAVAEAPAAAPAPTSPVVPPAARSATPAANQAPRRADQSTADLGGVARDAVAEQRQKSAVLADRAAVAPFASAPATANARLAAAPLVTPPASSVLDSAVNAIVGRSDSLRSNRLASAGFATAPGVITGKVIAADNSPLSNVSVIVAGAGIGVQTAADGSFTLPPLPPGQYTVEARRIGYSPAKLEGVQVASGDTAYARLALKAMATNLSEVVVTGTAAANPGQKLGLVVATPNVAGACFVLDVDAGGDTAGIPLLPRRVRIRMAESPVVAELVREEAKLARERAAAPAPAAARGYAGTPSEPTSPMPWQRVYPDSIGVTWATEGDVVTLRLEIRGDSVSGTATSSLGSPARTAKVSGQRVTCGR